MSDLSPLSLYLRTINVYEEDRKENIPPEVHAPERLSLNFLKNAGSSLGNGEQLVPIPVRLRPLVIDDITNIECLLEEAAEEHQEMDIDLAYAYYQSARLAHNIKQHLVRSLENN